MPGVTTTIASAILPGRYSCDYPYCQQMNKHSGNIMPPAILAKAYNNRCQMWFINARFNVKTLGCVTCKQKKTIISCFANTLQFILQHVFAETFAEMLQ